jgi:CRISPR-associated protein Cas5d
MFNRRIQRGQWWRTPCLGWQEFVPDYLGRFRSSTEVCKDLSITLPSMLEAVFPRQNDPTRAPKFRQDLRVIDGVLTYAP